MRPLIVDTDLNFPSDDFQALLLLLGSSEIEVLGCIAAPGNTWMEEVWFNLKGTLSLLGRAEIPVISGASWNQFAGWREWAKDQSASPSVPFIGAFAKSTEPRLSTGQFERLASTETTASEFFAQVGEDHSGELEILALGPLTSLAQSLRENPSLRNQIKRITCMAGNFVSAGRPDRSDFNVWFDAGSAQEVFSSGVPVRVVPLDVCRFVKSSSSLIERLKGQTFGWSKAFQDDFIALTEQHGMDMTLCDQLAALITIDESLIETSEKGRVEVDTTRGFSHGETQFFSDPAGTVKLITKVDREAAIQALLTQVNTMSPAPAYPKASAWEERIL